MVVAVRKSVYLPLLASLFIFVGALISTLFDEVEG